MDFSAALPTFVITLREGVEAALVVGIVLACLKKAEQTRLYRWVYYGVAAGIAASVTVGILLGGVLVALSKWEQPLAAIFEPALKGGFCLVAIAMLTWMLIWMTQQAKSLKGEIEGAVSSALELDSGDSNALGKASWGIFALIFIAVLREGFETVLFITAKFQEGYVPALGALLGLLCAVAIGLLLFKGGVRINIRLFFQMMGVFLLLIVSGLTISALKNFDAAVTILSQVNPELASLCNGDTPSCILGPIVWDASQFLPDNRFPGLLLKALFGYRSILYLAQAIGYVLFLVTAGSLYFWSLTGRPLPVQSPTPSSQQ